MDILIQTLFNKHVIRRFNQKFIKPPNTNKIVLK